MRRKSAANRVRRGTKDIGHVALVGELVVPRPPRPAGRAMLKATQEAWRRFWESDVAALVVDADRPALERLFGLYDLRARMEKVAVREPFAAGSMGQLKAHPALAEVASLDGRIVPLEDRFGITPAGRLKLGIVLGAAAKSLEDLNAEFIDDDQDDDGDVIDVDEIDPRVVHVDFGGSS